MIVNILHFYESISIYNITQDITLTKTTPITGNFFKAAITATTLAIMMENRNAIIKLVTKAANGYLNWERFRNRCMLILEKGIDFEIDKDDGSIKMVEKKDPDN